MIDIIDDEAAPFLKTLARGGRLFERVTTDLKYKVWENTLINKMS